MTKQKIELKQTHTNQIQLPYKDTTGRPIFINDKAECKKRMGRIEFVEYIDGNGEIENTHLGIIFAHKNDNGNESFMTLPEAIFNGLTILD